MALEESRNQGMKLKETAKEEASGIAETAEEEAGKVKKEVKKTQETATEAAGRIKEEFEESAGAVAAQGKSTAQAAVEPAKQATTGLMAWARRNAKLIAGAVALAGVAVLGLKARGRRKQNDQTS